MLTPHKAERRASGQAGVGRPWPAHSRPTTLIYHIRSVRLIPVTRIEFLVTDQKVRPPLRPRSLNHQTMKPHRPGETKALHTEHPEVVKELKALLDQSKSTGRSRPVRNETRFEKSP